MIPPCNWIITTPDQRQHRVVADVPQAIDFVAGALRRSVRLTPRYFGEAGETWLCTLAGSPAGNRAAPTVYADEAA